MARHHLIITGTGRAGTTFLVQLLTELGLDTGFADTTSHVDPTCSAGMERDLRDDHAPYIVKSPWMCDYLDEIVEQGKVIIDHAIVPMRDLYSAAQSRRGVAARSAAPLPPDQLLGGLWHTTQPAEQEAVLVRQLYKLVYALAKHDIPLTLLHFPRLALDADYLFAKAAPLLPNICRASFLRAFHTVSRPELVHVFEEGGSDC